MLRIEREVMIRGDIVLIRQSSFPVVQIFWTFGPWGSAIDSALSKSEGRVIGQVSGVFDPAPMASES